MSTEPPHFLLPFYILGSLPDETPASNPSPRPRLMDWDRIVPVLERLLPGVTIEIQSRDFCTVECEISEGQAALIAYHTGLTCQVEVSPLGNWSTLTFS